MTIKEEIEGLKKADTAFANTLINILSELESINNRVSTIPSLEMIVSGVWNTDNNVLLKKINNDLSTLMDFQMGNWEIKDNQMIFYKRNGDILAEFNLLNKYDVPTESSVYKRIKDVEK